MSRQVKIAAVLVSIAAALVIGYLAYQHSQAHSREALLNKSAEMAQSGYYADAARLIDRALTLPGDGVRSDEMLYLKKADYLQKSGDTAEALSIAMRVVKNTQEGQQEFDDAWERIVSILGEDRIDLFRRGRVRKAGHTSGRKRAGIRKEQILQLSGL